MALLALSKGQLLISIHKMCKENNMLHMYEKKFIKYTINDLASEYVKIESCINEGKRFDTIKNNDFYDTEDVYDDIKVNYKLNYKK